MLDVSGRVMTAVNNVMRNESVTVGKSFIAGTYFAEVRQGNDRKVIKLIKL